MARSRRNIETVLKIARMRYDQRLSPGEIAQAEGVSESTISRTLKLAMDLGFIDIQVTPAGWRDFGLEQRLVERLGLVTALVVQNRDPTEPFGPLPRVVAASIEERLAPGTVLGVSDGETVAAIAAAVRRGKSSDIDVVSMIGGIGSPQVHTHSTEICREFASHTGGRAWQMPAPAVVENTESAASLMGVGLVRAVFTTMARTSIALVGVGAMSPRAAVFSHGMIDPAEIDTIKAQGAVGSICARFYDIDGRPIASEFDDRTMAISLANLARVPLRIGAAVGASKITAIRAAIRGGLINALGTDTATADALLAPTSRSA
jgi:deoxyribonucleoside regulator